MSLYRPLQVSSTVNRIALAYTPSNTPFQTDQDKEFNNITIAQCTHTLIIVYCILTPGRLSLLTLLMLILCVLSNLWTYNKVMDAILFTL